MCQLGTPWRSFQQAVAVRRRPRIHVSTHRYCGGGLLNHWSWKSVHLQSLIDCSLEGILQAKQVEAIRSMSAEQMPSWRLFGGHWAWFYTQYTTCFGFLPLPTTSVVVWLNSIQPRLRPTISSLMRIVGFPTIKVACIDPGEKDPLEPFSQGSIDFCEFLSQGPHTVNPRSSSY